jgi:protein TonB
MLMLCLALSVALHLAMLVALPGFAVNPRPLQAHILDVVVQQQSMPQVSVRAGAEIPLAPPRRASRDIPAAAKTPEFSRHVDELDRKPEAEPIRPAALAGAARDAFANQAASAKQDEARSSAPPSTGITAGVTGTARDVAATRPVVNAGYLRNPSPPYPLVARRNGEQGTVILRVRVTREGMPASVDIEKTSRSSHLDDAALEAVRTWRFVPARQDGRPVEAWVLVPVVFKLEGTS